jgi:2'-hydroxyisoflavone reductase
MDRKELRMNILILGGTRFLGRALAESALERGHRLTLFHRGISNPRLFPQAEHLLGDRTTDLGALSGRRWDAVVDTCGYEPAVVRRSAELLAGAVDRYVFISSISVYADFRDAGVAEDAPLEQLPEGAAESFNMEYYGALKALCEQAAEAALPARTLNIRPGLIVGAHDPTDRFTYWPWRVSLGGEVLAPGRPERPVQFIDVRDLAEWTVHMVEAQEARVFNATGPAGQVTMGRLLETARQAAGSLDARLTWVDEAFLEENKVQPWTELPLFLPEQDSSMAGMNMVSIARALQAGLTFHSLEDTLRVTLDWIKTRPDNHQWKAGLRLEREQELLNRYRAWAA